MDRLSWRHTLAVRYIALSLVAAVGPLVLVGIVYDRFSSDLVQRISGERLARRVSTTRARMKAFLAAPVYQLDTLVAWPALSLLARDLPSPATGLIPSGRIAVLVRLASLTELLGTDGDADLVLPLLPVPAGGVWSAVGMPENAPPT